MRNVTSESTIGTHGMPVMQHRERGSFVNEAVRIKHHVLANRVLPQLEAKTGSSKHR